MAEKYVVVSAFGKTYYIETFDIKTTIPPQKAYTSGVTCLDLIFTSNKQDLQVHFNTKGKYKYFIEIIGNCSLSAPHATYLSP